MAENNIFALSASDFEIAEIREKMATEKKLSTVHNNCVIVVSIWKMLSIPCQHPK